MACKFQSRQNKINGVYKQEGHSTPFVFLYQSCRRMQLHKHLGLIFNTRLNWNGHVSEIMANVSKLLDVSILGMSVVVICECACYRAYFITVHQ